MNIFYTISLFMDDKKLLKVKMKRIYETNFTKSKQESQ